MNPRPLILFGIVISMVTGVALGILAVRVFFDDGKPQFATTLDRVAAHIEDSYVDEVSRQVLLESAINGMLNDLDKHSLYLDVAEYATLQEETAGHFGGIGIEIALVDGFYRIIAPIDDTPAAAAGLESGDTIIELNHRSMRGQKMGAVLRQMRGEPGTSVHLAVRREPEQRIDVDLVRALIHVRSVKGRLLEPGIGYLRISQFQTDTSEQLHQELDQLRAQGELSGLVIDLRNNPGGVLQASVDVADAFLADGLIVYTEGRTQANQLSFSADAEDVMSGKPIVVLINSGSASAAEIVAGALKDHDRATLIGNQTYGKGSVQSVVPIENARAIKLTTARYFTPSGISIQSEGIEPHMEVSLEDSEKLLSKALELLRQG